MQLHNINQSLIILQDPKVMISQEYIYLLLCNLSITNIISNHTKNNQNKMNNLHFITFQHFITKPNHLNQTLRNNYQKHCQNFKPSLTIANFVSVIRNLKIPKIFINFKSSHPNNKSLLLVNNFDNLPVRKLKLNTKNKNK